MLRARLAVEICPSLFNCRLASHTLLMCHSLSPACTTNLGVLACLDGYLNMALEQSEEYGPDGLLKAKYGDCFIRGNNGEPFICLVCSSVWFGELISCFFCFTVILLYVFCLFYSALCFNTKEKVTTCWSNQYDGHYVSSGTVAYL